jgi:hypothetical protein
MMTETWLKPKHYDKEIPGLLDYTYYSGEIEQLVLGEESQLRLKTISLLKKRPNSIQIAKICGSKLSFKVPVLSSFVPITSQRNMILIAWLNLPNPSIWLPKPIPQSG